MVFTKYLGDSKMFEYDKYYRDCQQQNKPFIKAKIHPQHGNYFVQIDLMPCDYNLSNTAQIQIKQLIQKEIQFVTSLYGESTFTGFNIDKELAWFDGVSSKHVHKFCEALYDLAQKNSTKI